jgi:DNA-binding winged helix-turn-helix (wHTH) protein
MSVYNSLVTEIPCLTLSGHPLNMQMQSIQIENIQIRLRCKLWQVLIHLVENQGILVSRQDLIEFCWRGNNFTGEQGVTHTICHLRRIFKKYSLAIKIITIPKKGYILEDNDGLAYENTFMSAVQLSARVNPSMEDFSSSLISLAK